MALWRDWNVVAITYERSDLFRVNGNRGKGNEAVKIRDNAKRHPRTLYWAVFDQKGRLLEGDVGPAQTMIPAVRAQRLAQQMAANESVRWVLSHLAKGPADKASKKLEWSEAAAEPTAALGGTYKLVVSSDDGEFESHLKLTQDETSLGGAFLAPDGQEIEIAKAKMEGGYLSFEVTFDPGDQPVTLTFRGKPGKRVIRGAFV